MPSHRTTIRVGDEYVETLADILPEQAGFTMLLVGKVPTPKSARAGHYLQGSQGTTLWNALRRHAIFAPTPKHEDDSLLDCKLGITDIVKVPRTYGNEPTAAEYRAGSGRVVELIRVHRSRVVFFLFGSALRELLKHHFGVSRRPRRGFNDDLEGSFGSKDAERFVADAT
jgi:G:T/U-mismatch repair DNA glycosylase